MLIWGLEKKETQRFAAFMIALRFNSICWLKCLKRTERFFDKAMNEIFIPLIMENFHFFLLADFQALKHLSEKGMTGRNNLLK